MNTLTKSKTAALWYATGDDSVEREVVSPGSRVCLRAYGMYSFGSWLTAGVFQTRANFMTTSDSTTPIFSDLSPLISWLIGYASVMCMVEVPGDGILFEDGLFIQLAEVNPPSNRNADMKTLLQVVYS